MSAQRSLDLLRTNIVYRWSIHKNLVELYSL